MKNKGPSRLFGNTYESWDSFISKIKDINGIFFRLIIKKLFLKHKLETSNNNSIPPDLRSEIQQKKKKRKKKRKEEEEEESYNPQDKPREYLN